MMKEKAKIGWLDYHPAGRNLDVEVLSFSDLRRRASIAEIRATHRYTFDVLICVTEGMPTQLVDFEPLDCLPGSVLVLRSGQVHSFGSDEGWNGWMVLFRSEFLPSISATTAELIPGVGFHGLPDHLSLPESEFCAVTEAIARMQQDAISDAPPEDLHVLLRHQLCLLLLRLTILHHRLQGAEAVQGRGLHRFAKFRALVEQKYSNWHDVAAYANALGCTEKYLTRAALEVTGRGAKQFISARITLEAKRLLAHTDQAVYLIANRLGFGEATNFAKFFRREAGCTPAEFRRRQSAMAR